MSHADLVFLDGGTFTAGDTTSVRRAVAVTDGRISAVGSDDDVREVVGPGTEVVRIGDGVLVPGFQDSHVHPVMAGLDMLRCDVHEARSADEVLTTIASYAGSHPELPWVVGAGWSMEHFPGGTPTREMLDRVVPDRPAFLPNRDCHSYWVNTKALELAGMSAATPDPADGRIEREPDGHPAGTLHEGAGALVARHVPAASTQDQYEGLLAAQQHLFSLGITSWVDAAVGSMFGQHDILDVYLKAATAGDLRARVVGSLWWDRDRGAEQLRDLVERRADAAAGRFRPTTVKVMQDGVAESFTAGMTEPYLDGCGCATANSGLSFIEPVALRDYVALLDAEGFQVHFHALGDRAVREALDAVEEARRRNGMSDGRHHLAHLQVVHPDDVPRFAALGATANIQPLWGAHEPQMDELTIPFLPENHVRWQYPFGDLHRSGAHIAAGSDWSVTSADPLAGIHVAVNRRSPERDAQTPAFFPENALTLAQAMTAYTAGSAFTAHQETSTGRLEVGMHADLAVLDRDPFTGDPADIARSTVTATYVGGELVHSTAR